MKKDPRKKITKKYLLKLEFEREDYKKRYFKLVNRVSLQEQEIAKGQTEVRALKSEIANNGLELVLVRQRCKDLENWIALKRPDVLKLEKVVLKQKANAAAGVVRPINVTLVQRRRLNKVPSTI